eukprot:CAMPEP_0115087166 /NCGR_PEP_ID=MMETSP0227-20121206/23081_1 /TAXON_ID=89957 /ORGANISM="Polarella glacialis, Strain CCMP 1383" /LENGTH=37 /DNA_ID= /DNA_START= /DNA_END= /DNA_ORIENTATION=
MALAASALRSMLEASAGAPSSPQPSQLLLSPPALESV